MARRNLAGFMWPSAAAIPAGSKAEDFEDYAGLRYCRSDDPDRTPHLDTPERHDKSALTMRLSTLQQAPTLSARMAMPLVNMLHLGPSSVSPRPGMIEVGDRGPDFRVTALDGRHVTQADFRGKPLVLMIMRIMGEGLFCPYSIPSAERMQVSYPDFTRRGVEVAVVLPTDLAKARSFVEAMEVTYPVYADPEWSLCGRYARTLGMLPLQASAILDASGVVRYLWRSDGGPKGDSLPPMPSLLLKQVDRLFGKEGTAP